MKTKTKKKYYRFVSTKIISVISPAVSSKEEAMKWYDNLDSEQWRQIEDDDYHYLDTETFECDIQGNDI